MINQPAQQQLNERGIVFLKKNGHNHDGLNSSPVYLAPGSIQDFHLSNTGDAGGNGGSTPTGNPTPILSVGGTEVLGVVPQNVTATPGASNENIFVDVAWTAPTVGGADQISQYQLQLIEIDDQVPTYGTTSQLTFRFNNLKPSTQYQVAVQVIFNSGQLGIPCTPILFSTGIDTTPPRSMIGIIAAAGFTTITVSWTANTDLNMANYKGSYQIDLAADANFTNIVQTQTTKGTVLSFGGLTTGTPYYIRGSAVSLSGIHQLTPTIFNQNPVTPGQPVPPPTDGKVPTGSVAIPTVVGGPGYLLVKWIPITNTDLVTYEIYGSTNPNFSPDLTNHTNLCGSTVQVGIGTTAVGQFFAKNINGTAFTYGTNYYFLVYARDGDGYTSAGPSPISVAAQMVQVSGGTNGDIAANTITANNIVANTITANQIAANTITAGQIAATTITAAQIVAGSISGDRISAATITGGNIAGQTITGTNIAGQTITAGNIVSQTITANQITTQLALIGNQGIQSQIYNPGVNGWRIWSDSNGNGNAEFNGGTLAAMNIRGSTINGGNIFGANFQTNSSNNAFIRLGTQGTGNDIFLQDNIGTSHIFAANGQLQFQSSGGIFMAGTVFLQSNIHSGGWDYSFNTDNFGDPSILFGPNARLVAAQSNDDVSLGNFKVKTVFNTWNAIAASSFNLASLPEFKENINEFTDSIIPHIKAAKIYTYNYVSTDPTNRNIGLMHPELPDFIQADKSTYSAASAVAALWKATQELTERLEKLESGKKR